MGRAAETLLAACMYADKITDSMRIAIDETKGAEKFRKLDFNKEHSIVPKTVEIHYRCAGFIAEASENVDKRKRKKRSSILPLMTKIQRRTAESIL